MQKLVYLPVNVLLRSSAAASSAAVLHCICGHSLLVRSFWRVYSKSAILAIWDVCLPYGERIVVHYEFGFTICN